MQYDESQQKAIELASTSRLSLITGGAGTGKTTIIKEIAQELGGTLCAPTGKASARLREATGFSSSTIHSLLGFDGHGFRNQDLREHNVIVDESSMADANLVGAIVKAQPKSLTLVGDFAQLHPVGPGAPFHDLIRLRPELVANLTTCYRSGEAVNEAGNHVREGEFPGFQLESENEKWQFIKKGDPETAEKTILSYVDTGEIDFSQDIVIVSRNGRKLNDDSYEPATVNSLNPQILELANPHYGDDKFAKGDRIICQENFADEDVWNGTTGTVTAVDMDNSLWVRTDVPTRDESGNLRDEVKFNKDMKRASRHAYALTIHKSQGSQYRRVFILTLNRDYVMLSRPLLYTAITRAKEQCIVIGQRRAFETALANLPQRETVLQQIAKHQDQ